MQNTQTIIAWTAPRPSALDMTRLLGAWLTSVLTGRPMRQIVGSTIWVGLITLTGGE